MKKIIVILVLSIIMSCKGEDSSILKTIKEGNLTALAKIFPEENDINAVYDGYTPLCYAVKMGVNTQVLDFLLENGAKIDLPSGGRKNPLMYAVKYRRTDLIKYLVGKGADVNFQNKKQANALLYAVKYENFEGFKKLIELGGDLNLKIKGDYTVLDYIKESNIKEAIEIVGLSYELKLQTDGPYVFKKEKGYDIVQTFPGDKNAIKKITTNTLDTIIKVMLDSKEKEFFLVQLQKEISIPETMYEAPKKLVAVSDIEGNFYAFKKILVGAGVMNENYQWIFEKGHLVLVGDFFDRGDNVTPVLWLIYELERQAKKAGGLVHFIIGNHEVMNFQGDYRYVDRKYKDTALGLNISVQELFGEGTVLGDWLTSKNCVEKIGDAIYVHGGLSKDITESGLTLEEMNVVAREYYRKSRSEIKNNINATTVFATKSGPLWYRGYFKNAIDQEEMDFITNYYKASEIIVGHTVVDENITMLYHKKLIAIDLKHPRKQKHGKVKALWKDKSGYYQIDETGVKKKLK